ncbi:MAG: ice-binding family protein [Bacteroidales bacterium]|nr:ice-binding family protein [Bacteroidales bacterium]
MKTSKLLTTLAIVSVVLIAGCKKDVETSIDPMGTSTVPLNYKSGLLPVTLGLTDGFAILSYAGITNTGPTTITGDVGASPITGASMTGFETVTIDGTIYTVDAAGPPGYVTNPTMLTQAMLDLTTAYNDAAGRTNPIGVAGNLGGQTLPPGLYKSTSSLEISSGDLTLDAQGDANAVWIFQIASSFNMTSGRQVFLIGGAQASNIFWQVGSAATFGTTAVMKGTIMAYANITFATGASLEGRALARTESVTLDANAIVKPTVVYFLSPAPALAVVNLGVAGDFAILSKTGITDVFPSAITGDVGSSPITGAAILVSCAEVTGTIYTVDAAGPLPCRVTNASMLTTAVSDMEAAYTDAAGRSNPDFLNLGSGNIGGLTLTPGLYKWTSTVIIPTDVTISGGPDDVWIFQVAGTLTMSSAVNITLTGGAQAKNIFWQVSGAVTFGTTSHFEGIILGMTGINLQTGGSINGRMLAQTAVTLQMNTVTQPQ